MGRAFVARNDGISNTIGHAAGISSPEYSVNTNVKHCDMKCIFFNVSLHFMLNSVVSFIRPQFDDL
jgi:hypothetical protein